MKRHKILYGICGIGNGHTYRQLPMVNYFAKKSTVVIFAYDASYNFYSQRFAGSSSVTILKVAVPFYVGEKKGLDFKATAESPLNKDVDFLHINCAAFEQANKLIGKPDLVITDYEPVSAQYAYMHDAPLVTIDQQSKYLAGKFPASLGGYTFNDEIARLHMFFPRANTRIACSFFKFPLRADGDKIQLFPSTLKDDVTELKRKAQKNNSILVYISSAREFGQSLNEVIRICASQTGTMFHIFSKNSDSATLASKNPSNIKTYESGDPLFYSVLKECTGIISTAGHSLLSEAMYLRIPVYAIPVSPYEQHMNAGVIDKFGFGFSHPRFDAKKLSYFIARIPHFTTAIADDKKILLRGMGQKKIIEFLEREYLNKK